MNEPVTGTVVAASVSAFSIATLFPTLQAPVVLGALCGALLLVISQKEIGLFLRIIFFCVAFVIGLLTADLFTALVAGYLPQHLMEKVSPVSGRCSHRRLPSRRCYGPSDNWITPVNCSTF